MIISYAPALEVFLHIYAALPFSLRMFVLLALCSTFGVAFIRFLLDL